MTDFERNDQNGLGQSRPEQIEREIERTRERMTQDIDAIGDKLRPSNLAHEAMESMTGGVRRTGSRFADFVRENPLPVVAVGLGLTWLVSQRSKSAISGDRMSRYAYSDTERRSGMAARLGEAKTYVQDLGTGARRQATENPLAVAAGALIVGLAIGLLLPETTRENELMGSARDRLAERAGDVKEKAQDVATQVVKEVKDAATQVKEQVEEQVATT